MDDQNVSLLIQRHEMGQAYRHITSKMGPSHQLIAFVNYDQVGENGLGLESFNIMDQHAAILTEIDSDTSLQIACEGLIARLLGIKEKAHQEQKIPEARPKEDIPTCGDYLVLKHQFNLVHSFEKDFLSKIPSNPDEKEWEKFSTYVKARVTKLNNELGHIPGFNPSEFGKKLPAEKSGWTKSNCESEVSKTESDQKELAAFHNKLGPIVTKLSGWINDSKTPTGVIKAINETFKAPFMNSGLDLHSAAQILGQAKAHFDSES